jgi:adenine-specific DNA methylase
VKYELLSWITDEANTEEEALGQMLMNVDLGQSTSVVNWAIAKHENQVDIDLQHESEIAFKTFFRLIKKFNHAICMNSLSRIHKNQRIHATKQLRDLTCPYLCLKDCKIIIDTWINEYDQKLRFTPLTTMILDLYSKSGPKVKYNICVDVMNERV